MRFAKIYCQNSAISLYCAKGKIDGFVVIRKTFLLLIFALQSFPDLAEQFKQAGYVEICEQMHTAATFDSLYVQFDELIEFLQKNPVWAQKLYSAKERFIR